MLFRSVSLRDVHADGWMLRGPHGVTNAWRNLKLQFYGLVQKHSYLLDFLLFIFFQTSISVFFVFLIQLCVRWSRSCADSSELPMLNFMFGMWWYFKGIFNTEWRTINLITELYQEPWSIEISLTQSIDPGEKKSACLSAHWIELLSCIAFFCMLTSLLETLKCLCEFTIRCALFFNDHSLCNQVACPHTLYWRYCLNTIKMFNQVACNVDHNHPHLSLWGLQITVITFIYHLFTIHSTTMYARHTLCQSECRHGIYWSIWNC